MSAEILALILIVIFIIVAQIIWRLFFCHLFQIRDKLSLEIREAIFPDIHKTINTLISLAAAAIVLTFSIVKILKVQDMFYKPYLIASWISFTLVILFGVGSMIILYILRAQYMITIRNLERARKEAEVEEKVVNDLESSLNKGKKIERTFHILLYCQAVTFVSAIIFLVMFTIANF